MAEPPSNEEPTAEPCFFKKSRGNKVMRKRPSGDEEVTKDEDEGSAVVRKAKNARKADGQLFFSSQGSSSSVKKASAMAEEERGKTNFFYESTREIQTQTDNRATATLETETEFDKDARAIRERVLKQAEEALRFKQPYDDEKQQGDKQPEFYRGAHGYTDDGKKQQVDKQPEFYKGIHGYTDHKAGFRREHTIAGEKAGGAHGPLRASAHIKWSARFDYQPDICKDYKETGYCGYGDACKFMHDRGDYKSGWQMDREWDEAEKKRKAKLAQRIQDEGEKSEEEEVDGDLPFACYICRQPFEDPVVTICKHYFCEHCALKHHARNKRCFVCNKPTNGTFNRAFEILKREAAERDKLAGDH